MRAATSAASAVLVVFMCAGRPRGPDTEYAFVHVDPLGTPLAVTGSPAVPIDAVAIWRARYYPFGRAAVDEGGTCKRIRSGSAEA